MIVIRSLFILSIFTSIVSCTTVKTSINKEKITYRSDQKNKKGRKITFETILRCNADTIWESYQKPAAWLINLNPKAKLIPNSKNKKINQWVIDKNYSFKLYMYGFIPFGNHHIMFESIDSSKLLIQSREHGFLVPHWDNTFTIIPIDDSTCIIQDVLTIQTKGINSIVNSYAISVFKAKHKKLKQKFESLHSY